MSIHSLKSFYPKWTWARISSLIFYSSLILFIISTYLGIVGYLHPWKSMSILSILSLLILIIVYPVHLYFNFWDEYLREKNKVSEKEANSWWFLIKHIIKYIYPIIGLIVVFFWAMYFNPDTPIYGKDLIYNPLSFLGIGCNYYSNAYPEIKYDPNAKIFCSPHNYLSRFYSFILAFISANLYALGDSTMIFCKTTMKTLVGYVPAFGERTGEPSEKNFDLENINKWYIDFLQQRLTNDGYFGILGGFLRRFSTIGLDLPMMDAKYCKSGYRNPEPFILHWISEYISNNCWFLYLVNWLYYILPVVFFIFTGWLGLKIK